MLFFKFHDFARSSIGKRDKVVLINFSLSLLINIILWVILFFALSGFTEYIILKYNIYFGISALGPWYEILFIPAFGLLVTVINFFIALHLYLGNKILSCFLAFSTTVLNVALLVAGALLIYNNF